MPRPDNSLEKKKWYKNAMAVLGLVGGTAALIATVVGLWPKPERPAPQAPEPPLQNVEIVLDRSELMSQPFENDTKLAEAKAEITQLLDKSIASADNLALREFGGPDCGPQNTQLTVSFNTNNRDQLKERLGSLTPSGRPDLVRAVIEATGDFNVLRQFRSTATRVVVITAGYRECADATATPSSGADIAAAIQERLKSYKAMNPNLQFDLHFIGVALTSEDAQALAGLAQSTGASFINAGNRDQLDQALHRILVIEPGIHNANSMTEILNKNVDHLNATVAAINQHDYDAAERNLGEATSEFEASRAPFAELGLRQNPGLLKLYEIASQSRQEQQNMIDAARTLIPQARANDVDGINKTVDTFNAHSNAYNDNVRKMDELRQQVFPTHE